MEDTRFWMLWGVLGAIMLVYYLRRQHKIRSFLTGAWNGLLALLLVHYGGSLFGYAPALNVLHLLQWIVLGIPGVILMVVLHVTL
ncbi:MAG: pro-sigmaK processing inhibitor BofA family protein [Ruminococcus sp.]|nr:pro-sigmaK processing inhibitor BofA family protein [Ruminococcus sp.]